MEKYEITKYMNTFNEKIESFKVILNLDDLHIKIKNLESDMSSPNFWDDNTKAKRVVSELNKLKQKVSKVEEVIKLFEELNEFIGMDDDSLSADIENQIGVLEDMIDKFEIDILLAGKYDSQNAILDIHPGAGGTESQDWAEMLYSMYLRFCERKSYKVEVLDYQNGEEAGIKSVSIMISGEDVYGNLKSEVGVHRLVRISPFDSNSRRHTSFASVDLTPDLDEAEDVEINEDDLRIDTFRASGAGGQHVNTTDSAVRIKHIPSGIVVSCQSQRSQLANRKKAIDLLRVKLMKEKQLEFEATLKDIGGDKLEIGWGSQIRSYVLHPYSLVKDHRTNYEHTNPQKVLQGELEGFINEYLRYKAKK